MNSHREYKNTENISTRMIIRAYLFMAGAYIQDREPQRQASENVLLGVVDYHQKNATAPWAPRQCNN